MRERVNVIFRSNVGSLQQLVSHLPHENVHFNPRSDLKSLKTISRGPLASPIEWDSIELFPLAEPPTRSTTGKDVSLSS